MNFLQLPHFFAILLVTLLHVQSWAQSGQPPAAGARAWAMAGTGLCFQDAYAAFSNQAGLAFLDRVAVVTGGDLRFSQSSIQSGFAAVALPLDKGGVAVSVSRFGNSFLNENRIGLGYGRKFSQKLGIGVQMDYLRMQIPDNGNANVLTFEIGVQAQVSKQVMLATHVYSPLQVKLGETEPLPTLLRLGSAWQLDKQLVINTELVKDIDFATGFRLGVAYTPINAFVFRAGVQTLPVRYSFGAGYKLGQTLQIDVAADFMQRLGTTPAVSLMWQGKSRKK